MGRFSWLGSKTSPRDDKQSTDRARRHKHAKPSRDAQRFESGGYCPAGVYHRGPCRHR